MNPYSYNMYPENHNDDFINSLNSLGYILTALFELLKLTHRIDVI